MHNLVADIEGIYVKLNLRKTKWLISGCYHPLDQNERHFFNKLEIA